MSLFVIDALNINVLRLIGFTKSLAMRSEHIVNLTYIRAAIIPWNNGATRDADRFISTEVAKY